MHKHWRPLPPPPPLPFHSPNWRPQSESTQRVQAERKEKGERDQFKSGSAFLFRNIKIIKRIDHKKGIILLKRSPFLINAKSNFTKDPCPF